MFTPIRSTQNASDSGSVENPANFVLTLNSPTRSIIVDHDGFSIGASPHCDLTLVDASIPPLHSIIHQQSGIAWIEAADDNVFITVNDRPCRRMTFRSDDRLKIGATEFAISLQPQNQVRLDEPVMNEDLALLTAEELCDRILSEQTMVAEFAEGQRSGWEALLRAINDANQEITSSDQHFGDRQVALNELLGQIQELNEAIVIHTRELNQRESEVLASTSALEESQQRIDKIVDQLNQNDPPNELRASA